MAASDYRLCDVCQCKVFYDSNLNYDHCQGAAGIRNAGQITPGMTLDRLGDWCVICQECAEKHECVIVKKGPSP